MNPSVLISGILGYIQEARAQKVNNLTLSAGKDPAQDRFNCGAISAYDEINKHIAQLVKSDQ